MLYADAHYLGFGGAAQTEHPAVWPCLGFRAPPSWCCRADSLLLPAAHACHDHLHGLDLPALTPDCVPFPFIVMAGGRTQKNKPHKTRFASKSSRNAHKLSGTKINPLLHLQASLGHALH